MTSTLGSVLIVDDSPTTCATLSGRLRRSGYDVELAETGEDALQLMRMMNRGSAAEPEPEPEPPARTRAGIVSAEDRPAKKQAKSRIAKTQSKKKSTKR